MKPLGQNLYCKIGIVISLVLCHIYAIPACADESTLVINTDIQAYPFQIKKEFARLQKINRSYIQMIKKSKAELENAANQDEYKQRKIRYLELNISQLNYLINGIRVIITKVEHEISNIRETFTDDNTKKAAHIELGGIENLLSALKYLEDENIAKYTEYNSTSEVLRHSRYNLFKSAYINVLLTFDITDTERRIEELVNSRKFLINNLQDLVGKYQYLRGRLQESYG